jgi:hypothetical protein
VLALSRRLPNAEQSHGDESTRAREPCDVQWLAISLVLSIVLTVVLNLAVRAFPHASERVMNGVAGRARPSIDGEPRRRIRMFGSWKAMLLGSLVLTLVLNLALWFR